VVLKLGGGTEAGRAMGRLLSGVGSQLASEAALAEARAAFCMAAAFACYNHHSVCALPHAPRDPANAAILPLRNCEALWALQDWGVRVLTKAGLGVAVKSRCHCMS
jgi:hypothetical protein